VEQPQFNADPTDTFRDYLLVPAEKRGWVVESFSSIAGLTGGAPR
jgi:hypothetical protein